MSTIAVRNKAPLVLRLLQQPLAQFAGITLHPVRRMLNSVEFHDPKFAQFICNLIPTACPFERDVRLLGHTLFHVPAMCKLNPLYGELVEMRFRAMTYLAEAVVDR
ncbi:Mo-dependent nitrogenase C-terminal domain-containing protein [Synechococcus sp. PCC 7336]|uniref:Mo-dependent nitrogenase C-terminal domain-containing protein n=1 Tax=Synechococcus sp. PCC 7336 TaxID=195250 RepID=UPI0003712526|nr:Mo-dependent nitrogenase C-terminal domain-containing protein [Synechococcus sp. PCC 7336]